MKKINLSLAAVVTAGMMMFTGCKKDDDTTYQPVGTYGNGNVQTTNETVASNQWTADGNGGWQTTFTATTGFDPTKGAISMFWSSDNTNWLALPVTVSANATIAYSFNSNGLTVDLAAIGTTALAQPTTTCYFKIVVVAPAMVKPNVNVHSYTEMKAAYHLD
ncbi:MAG: hypothetical protein ACYDCN_14440 [Bacteroidia bacterium]